MCFNLTKMPLRRWGWILGGVVITSSFLLLFVYSLHFGLSKSQGFMLAFLFFIMRKLLIKDVIITTMRAAISALMRKIPQENIPICEQKTISMQSLQIQLLKDRLKTLKLEFIGKQALYEYSCERERRREKYETILYDLFMFVYYMLTLLMIVLGSRDPYAYYSTFVTKDFLESGKFSSLKSSNVLTDEDFYVFVNDSLLENFHNGADYNGNKIPDPGWLTLEISKLLGVSRLRQQRFQDSSKSTSGWRRFDTNFIYTEKLAKIAKPWVYQTPTDSEGIAHFGEFGLYSGGGFLSPLGRTLINSRKLLQFLKETHWIDQGSLVAFVEFTLYNCDTNLFNIVTLISERTPFNTHWITVNVETVKLLLILQNLPIVTLMAFLAYVLMIIVFVYIIIENVRVSRFTKFLSNAWNLVDLILVVLSMATVVLFIARSHYVADLLNVLEKSKHNKFVSFYHALLFDNFLTWLSAFLVCLATIRIWKILQFSSFFRVFTKTLFKSASSLMSTSFFIAIFLVAFSLSASTINGNNEVTFSKVSKSLTTLMAFALGFTGQVSTNKLNHGGTFLGVVFYILLMFVVSIFLLNMFITVLCHYFAAAKTEKESEENIEYSFWDFLGERYQRWNPKNKIIERKSLKSGMETPKLKILLEILATEMKLIKASVKK